MACCVRACQSGPTSKCGKRDYPILLIQAAPFGSVSRTEPRIFIHLLSPPWLLLSSTYDEALHNSRCQNVWGLPPKSLSSLIFSLEFFANHCHTLKSSSSAPKLT